MRSKECTECGEVKPVDSFHRAKIGLYGHYSKCKECKNALTRKYLSTPAGKKARLRANKKYYRTKKGKKQKAKDQRAFCQRYPKKHSAHRTIAREIELGRIPKASDCTCYNCGKHAVEYHHHNGYAKRYYRDVIPLCKGCHKIAG